MANASVGLSSVHWTGNDAGTSVRRQAAVCSAAARTTPGAGTHSLGTDEYSGGDVPRHGIGGPAGGARFPVASSLVTLQHPQGCPSGLIRGPTDCKLSD